MCLCSHQGGLSGSDATGAGGSSAMLPSHLPDPRTLDTLLGELTLLNARADLFLRFMRRRVVVGRTYVIIILIAVIIVMSAVTGV